MQLQYIATSPTIYKIFVSLYIVNMLLLYFNWSYIMDWAHTSYVEAWFGKWRFSIKEVNLQWYATLHIINLYLGWFIRSTTKWNTIFLAYKITKIYFKLKCKVYCVEIGNVYVDTYIISCNAMGKYVNLIWGQYSCFDNSIVDYTKLQGWNCI